MQRSLILERKDLNERLSRACGEINSLCHDSDQALLSGEAKRRHTTLSKSVNKALSL